jgi:aconitate hydratase
MQIMQKNKISLSSIKVEGESYACVDLPATFGAHYYELPVVLRLLLENVVRNMSVTERDVAIQAIFDWLDTGTSEAEIAFQPGRVLMHDTTSTPALVDIAAMRDALSEAGVDPTVLNPCLQVDVSVDHSLAVEAYAKPNSDSENLQHEIRRNSERYKFLRWASKVLKGVRINPPGTGIMHTINLEQLATVVTKQERNGTTWVLPDMMIGTDSHTPMVNGIGVLAWGVGGLEAQTVMFGMPTMLRIPDVVGVKLEGKFASGVLATDLALVVTHELRKLGVTGEFVEFYGSGVKSLTASERCVVANMAPEYGATTGYFPIDEQTLTYLKATGRTENAVALVEAFAKQQGFWLDGSATPRYTKSITIDLSSIEMHISGPKRPQDLWSYWQSGEVLRALEFQPASTSQTLPKHPVAIAAITSCTNTSDPALLIAAGLLARKARHLGLRVPAWVKTSLGPGSPAAASYLKRAGLLADLESVGFGIVGYGCTTCIGNSGDLPLSIVQAQKELQIQPVAILSGNRNFPGRIHPDLELAFIMSPPLVIAFGLAGDACIDMSTQPIQVSPKGDEIHLKDIWPTNEEILQFLARALDVSDFKREFKIASENPLWHALKTPDAPLYPWDDKSTILRRPPFAAVSEGSQLGKYKAYPLMVLGDDVTTDHISPASAIPPNSLVADFLVTRGDNRNDLNVFASRRGNWEVMMRAAFHSKTLVNLLKPNMPMAHTLHVPSGDVQPIWDVAQRYKDAGESVVLIAGERYGMGSSRDWAAKGQRLLGIRAVLAVSFERIHRSNLIGMGILPLWLPDGVTPQTLFIQPGDQFELEATVEVIQPRATLMVRIYRVDGQIEKFQARAAIETQFEVDLLREGGVIPSILHKTIRDHKTCDNKEHVH